MNVLIYQQKHTEWSHTHKYFNRERGSNEPKHTKYIYVHDGHNVYA